MTANEQDTALLKECRDLFTADAADYPGTRCTAFVAGSDLADFPDYQGWRLSEELLGEIQITGVRLQIYANLAPSRGLPEMAVSAEESAAHFDTTVAAWKRFRLRASTVGSWVRGTSMLDGIVTFPAQDDVTWLATVFLWAWARPPGHRHRLARMFWCGPHCIDLDSDAADIRAAAQTQSSDVLTAVATRWETARPQTYHATASDIFRTSAALCEYFLDASPSSPHSPNNTREAQLFDSATRALAILAKSPPTVKVKEIATAVGVSDKYLYAHPIFGPAWQAFKNINVRSSSIRRGKKSNDGTIEAVDEVENDDS